MKKILLIITAYIQGLGEDKKDHNYLGQITGFPSIYFSIIVGLILGSFFSLKHMEYILPNIAGLLCLAAYALKEIVHDGMMEKGNKEFLDWWHNSLPIFQYLIIIDTIWLITYLK